MGMNSRNSELVTIVSLYKMYIDILYSGAYNKITDEFLSVGELLPISGGF